MANPRDPLHREPSERQQGHLRAISEAAELLLECMHNAEGSTLPGEHQDHVFTTRRMSLAANHIETAVAFALKAAMETR